MNSEVEREGNYEEVNWRHLRMNQKSRGGELKVEANHWRTEVQRSQEIVNLKRHLKNECWMSKRTRFLQTRSSSSETSGTRLKILNDSVFLTSIILRKVS